VKQVFTDHRAALESARVSVVSIWEQLTMRVYNHRERCTDAAFKDDDNGLRIADRIFRL